MILRVSGHVVVRHGELQVHYLLFAGFGSYVCGFLVSVYGPKVRGHKASGLCLAASGRLDKWSSAHRSK
jgi:hypothetical protein